MPTEVSIVYSTDLGQAESSSTTDSAWIEWSMSGAGAAYYTGSPPGTLTVGSSIFNIALARTGGDPANGDYIVDLDVILRYNNDGTEFILDHVIYTLTVHVGGASTEKSTAAGSISNGSISAGSVTDDLDGAGAIPPTTPTLTLAQVGGTLAFGDDIDLTVTLTGSDHTIWVDPSDPIIVSEDADFVNGLNYEWPSTALTSSTEVETGTTTSVEITLKSLPVRVFDWGTVYVQLTVHHRDISARRRALRRRRGLQQEEDDGSSNTQDIVTDGQQQQSTDRIFAKVTFHSDDSGGMAVSSLVLVSSTTAMAAGAALFMI
jgi:hypothetical protein